MNLADTADVWWKTAVFYCADVQTFLDLDGDGDGDLRGMLHRVDYLADLGVTCLWLMPFYPTAGRDDGYDITDFYGVDPTLGSAGDFVELVRTCRSRGIRVVVDFVMNHTSDRHPWWKERPAAPRPAAGLVRLALLDTSRHRKQVVFPDKEDASGRRTRVGRVVPPQLLQDPARPQPRQPGGARRGDAHDGLLVAARRRRLPHRRRPVPLRRGQVPEKEQKRASTRTTICATSRRTPIGATATRCSSARSTCPTRRWRSSSAAVTPTSCPCSSTSSGCRRPTCRWRAATRGRWPRRSANVRRSTPAASGPTSCATTTSSPSTSSPRPSARRSSTRSVPTRRCSSTTAGSGAGCRRCWAATSDGSGWRTP